jgi:hypothetical protein
MIVDNTLFEIVSVPPESEESLLSYYWIHPTYVIFDVITWSVYIISMVIFFWWIHRANKNIHTFGAREVYSPRMSVIWFLIPLLNLRNGYESVKQIWTASNTSTILTKGFEWKDPSISLKTVKTWWFIVVWIPFLGILFFILLTPFIVIFSPIPDAPILETPEPQRSPLSFFETLYSLGFIIFANILTIIALVYYIRIIKQISEWQELKSKS